MSITLPAELEKQAREKAKAVGLTIDAYVELLIREDDWHECQGEETQQTDPEFDEVRSGITVDATQEIKVQLMNTVT